MLRTYKQFLRFTDIYYWKTAVLLARNLLSRQYRNSFLGMVWTLLQPMTMVLVYASIMPLLMHFSGTDYALYIITSLPLWNFFSTSLVAASLSLISQGETLKRCMVSSTLFPVADVMKNFYTYLISFAAMYTMLVLFVVPFSWTVLLVPLYLIPVVITVMAFAIAVAFVAPYLRDVGEIITMGMSVMIWLTPVFYPLRVIPEEYRNLMEWNPFFIMLHPVQMLVHEQKIPEIADVERLIALMFIAIAVGYAVYKRCRRNYVYYL